MSELKPKDPLMKAFLSFRSQKRTTVRSKEIEKYSIFTRGAIERWIFKFSFNKKREIPSFEEALPNFTNWVVSSSHDIKKQRLIWFTLMPRLDSSIVMRVGNKTVKHRDWSNDGVKYLLERKNEMSIWLKEMLQGLNQYQIAWNIRGRGYANTVKKESWSKFYSHLEKSVVFFKTAYELAPHFPEAAFHLQQIYSAYGGSKESMRTWFNKTIEAECDFMPAYTQYIFHLRPRWGGSFAKMAEFGVACAETQRFDTQIPFLLRKVTLDILEENRDDWRVIQKLNIYPAMNQMFTGYAAYEKKYDVFTQSDRKLIQTKHLSYTLNLSKYEYLDDVLKCLTKDNYRWSGTGKALRDLKVYESFAFVDKSNISTRLRFLSAKFLKDFNPEGRLMPSLNKKEITRSQKELEELTSLCNTPELERFLKYFSRKLQIYQKLYSGDWVNVDFLKDRDFIYVNNRTYRELNSDSCRVSLGSSNLFFDFVMPVNTEFEFTLQYKRRNPGQCLVLTSRSPEETNSVFLRGDGLSGVHLPSSKKTFKNKVPKKSKVNIKYWNGALEYHLNDKQQFSQVYDRNDAKGRNIYFTSLLGNTMYGGDFIISSVKIRQHSHVFPGEKTTQ